MRTSCARLRSRWLAAEKRAHKTLAQGKRAAHKKHEHASERIYESAAKSGCRWVR